jgi:hypothetical protein
LPIVHFNLREVQHIDLHSRDGSGEHSDKYHGCEICFYLFKKKEFTGKDWIIEVGENTAKEIKKHMKEILNWSKDYERSRQKAILNSPEIVVFN